MARKKSQTQVPDSIADSAAGEIAPATLDASQQEDEPVQVNNASLNDMRYAVEDFIKEHCDREDSYEASRVHEDVHLALGWTCVLLSGATCLYAYYTPFDQSKLLTAVGIALYAIFAAAGWLWDRFVVKDTVFLGKRRVFRARIESEVYKVDTKQLEEPVENPPLRLTADYTRTANSGKSLVLQSSKQRLLKYAEVFDSHGILHKDKLAAVLDQLERDVHQAS